MKSYLRMTIDKPTHSAQFGPSMIDKDTNEELGPFVCDRFLRPVSALEHVRLEIAIDNYNEAVRMKALNIAAIYYTWIKSQLIEESVSELPSRIEYIK